MSPAFPETRAQSLVIKQADESISEIVGVATMHHERLALVLDDVPEAGDVGTYHRGLARHRFEQRYSERCLGRGAGVHRAVCVVPGTIAQHRADERYVRIAAGGAVVMAAKRPVTDDDELC